MHRCSGIPGLFIDFFKVGEVHGCDGFGMLKNKNTTKFMAGRKT
jgi:hypothetical protein